jgi:hypothetical protein
MRSSVTEGCRPFIPDPLPQLDAAVLAADANFVRRDNPAVLDMARQVVHHRLGLDGDGNAGSR